MLGLSGLAQSALAAMPALPPSETVPIFRNLSWHQPYALIGLRMQSPRGGTIRTGIKSYFPVPSACTLVGYTLLANAVGSIVIDILRSPAGTSPPVDSITFGNRPSLTNAQSIQDRSLLNWQTTLSRGDILAIEVLSCSGISNATLALIVSRTF